MVSVSGDGMDLPYGVLLNRENWAVQISSAGNPPTVLSALPEKKIVLDAPSVNVAAGSTIDIRGGGNLHASEFVVGSGGSHDILAMPNTYAIMPAFASATAAVGHRWQPRLAGRRQWSGSRVVQPDAGEICADPRGVRGPDGGGQRRKIDPNIDQAARWYASDVRPVRQCGERGV